MRKAVVKILNLLSREIILKYKPVVIGVTGSVGKSSTSEIISEILQTKFEVRSNNSRYRTDLSVPLAIIGVPSGRHSVLDWIGVFGRAGALLLRKSSFYPDILVLEMGIDRPEDMKKMLELVHPHVAVFTSLGEFPAHTEYFKSDKHVAREKSLLFKALGKSDLAVLNVDDRYIQHLSGNLKMPQLTFGFSEAAQVKGEEIFLSEKKWRIESGQIGMSFKITYEGTTVPFRFPYALGRGQIYAALAGSAVGLHLGFNLVEISEALTRYRALPGRMNLIRGRSGTLLIDDTFNSNPSSALSALETIEKLEATRKIAVLGDMLELGNYTKEGHKRVGENIPKSVDLLFCYGENARYFCDFAREKGMKADRIFHFGNKQEMINKLQSTIQSGDVILVKGSRATRMEEVVKELMLEPQLSGELLVQ